MNAQALEKQLQRLKKEFADVGISIPGSIQTMFLRCGKKNCRCH
jgi:hypothetical protein